MANYECTIRTNYFHVRNAEVFRDFMARVYGAENGVKLWQEKDKAGKPVFGFGCSGGIAGLRNAAEDFDVDVAESAYDEFIDGLQEHVAKDDAVIILECGHEKLNYTSGHATIITREDVQVINLTDLAKRKAASMLQNPKWSTKCEY